MSALRLALIGHGHLPIPPQGFGAVETLIWDYKTYLEKLGHTVVVVNTKNEWEIIGALRRASPDVVHVHSESYAKAIAKTDVPIKIFTTHDPHFPSGTLKLYRRIPLFSMLKDNFSFFALSSVHAKKYLACGCPPESVFVTPNGTDHEKFRFRKTPVYRDRSIYLGQIIKRKRQYVYQGIASIDFVGPIKDRRQRRYGFDDTRENYLGERSRDQLYEHLSDYANLVLLSRNESAAPLVVLEALVCGLGVVVSEACTPNLDISLAWVSVIPDDRLDDLEYVENEIARNRHISIQHRKQIRTYGIENFSQKKQIARYADLCVRLCADAGRSSRYTLSRGRLAYLYFRFHLPASIIKVFSVALRRFHRLRRRPLQS